MSLRTRLTDILGSVTGSSSVAGVPELTSDAAALAVVTEQLAPLIARLRSHTEVCETVIGTEPVIAWRQAVDDLLLNTEHALRVGCWESVRESLADGRLSPAEPAVSDALLAEVTTWDRVIRAIERRRALGALTEADDAQAVEIRLEAVQHQTMTRAAMDLVFASADRAASRRAAARR